MAPTTDTDLEAFTQSVPGVYRGIPAETYHALDAISSTFLKRIITASPAHAREDQLEGIEPTDDMNIGSGGHCCLFTPTEFDEQFVCSEVCSKAKADGRPCENGGKILSDGRWYCGVHGKGLVNDAGKTILTPDHMARVTGVCSAVRSDAKAAAILEEATEFELSLLWIDAETGLLCKARLDILCGKTGIIPDLKVCRGIRFFNDDFFNRAYHVQMAHYMEGALANGIPADLSAIIAVESARPHCVATPELPPQTLRDGLDDWHLAMETAKRCLDADSWPGPELKHLVRRWKKYQPFEGENE